MIYNSQYFYTYRVAQEDTHRDTRDQDDINSTLNDIAIPYSLETDDEEHCVTYFKWLRSQGIILPYTNE